MDHGVAIQVPLLAKNERWCTGICEVLFGMSIGQNREEEDGGIIAASPHPRIAMEKHLHGFHSGDG